MSITLQEKIQQLPPELEQEVEHFIEYILQKETPKKQAKNCDKIGESRSKNFATNTHRLNFKKNLLSGEACS